MGAEDSTTTTETTTTETVVDPKTNTSEETKTEETKTEETKVEETKEKTSVVTAPPENTETPEKPPENYDLKLPEDSLLDKSAIERTAAQAKEQGLSNDAAQEFLNRQSQALTDHVDKQSEAWEAAVKADPEIGGDNYGESVEMARRVVARFGNDALKKSLTKYGYGNHPEVVRFCANIGKAMSEDKLIQGATKPMSSKPKTAAEKLYGDPLITSENK
jgi:hypothetical protein